MIEKTEAAQQVARLSGFPFWGTLTRVAQDELVNAIAACCESVNHAKVVMDEWINTQRELPTPADLRAIARANNPEPPPQQFRGYEAPKSETPEQIAEGIESCLSAIARLENRHGPLVADLLAFWRKELTRLETIRLQNVSECANR